MSQNHLPEDFKFTEKPIKVLFASGVFFSFAGSSKRYRQYFKTMPFSGISPIVATSPPLRRKLVDEYSDIEPIPGFPGWVKVDKVPARCIRSFGESKIMRRPMLFFLVYWMLLSCPDIKIVHILQQMKFITFPWVIILRLFSTIKVLSITKDYVEKRFSFTDYLQRLQFNSYDAIICQSEDQYDYLKALGVKTEIKIVPNGVDTNRLSPVTSPDDKQKLRESLGLPKDEIIVLYVGSVQPRKGTDILLAAWQKVICSEIKARLCIIGPRFDLKSSQWPNFTATIEKLMAEPNMKHTVEFHGYRDNVADYLRAADAFVFPSENEGVPNAVLEAMACELPCVLTPFFKRSKQLGQPEQHFKLVERSPDSLAKGLLAVMENPEQSKHTMGRKARELMVETMSMNHSVELHNELYRKLLKHRLGLQG